MGAGAHATVVFDLLRNRHADIVAICDPRLTPGEVFWGITVISEEQISTFSPSKCQMVNSIGSNRSLDLRKQIFIKYKNLGYQFISLIHQSAVIATNARLGEGVQIMAGSIVQPKTYIGENALINSGAIVEHDCHLGASVHVAPGAVLCSGVQVGEGSHIGAGAVVIQNTTIGNNALVGANTTVLKNIPDHEKFLG